MRRKLRHRIFSIKHKMLRYIGVEVLPKITKESPKQKMLVITTYHSL